MVNLVKADVLKKWLDNHEAFLVDVRNPAEYRADHIEQAHLIPAAELSVEKIPPDTKRVVIHCGVGILSRKACESLLKKNLSIEIYNLEGGIVAWRNAGFPTQKSPGGRSLPLDRQVQVTAGFLTFFGIVLGYFVHPGFLVLSAFIGAGLMFAGLSGFCGMEKILAKMPWNQ